MGLWQDQLVFHLLLVDLRWPSLASRRGGVEMRSWEGGLHSSQNSETTQDIGKTLDSHISVFYLLLPAFHRCQFLKISKWKNYEINCHLLKFCLQIKNNDLPWKGHLWVIHHDFGQTSFPSKYCFPSERSCFMAVVKASLLSWMVCKGNNVIWLKFIPGVIKSYQIKDLVIKWIEKE